MEPKNITQQKLNLPFIFTVIVFAITSISQYITTQNEVSYLKKDMDAIKQQIKDYNVLTYKVDKIDRKIDDIILLINK